MLQLARQALEAFVAGRSPPALPDAPAARERRGAFVTLEAAGALRGCIGHVPADRPLGDVVRDVAVGAARDDPRFDPVNRTELADLRIEISVLTEPVALRPVAVDRIVIGRDGVVVRRGGATSVLLPQVGREQGWDAAALLRAARRADGDVGAGRP